MNYLAHLYLSGHQTEVILGNFMADSIKGNAYKKYPEFIKNGILLHRFIDSFTDNHPLVLELKKLMYHELNHYSGVAIDVLLDHILAKKWSIYSEEKLNEFVQEKYQLLSLNKNLLTKEVKNFLPIMIKHDWLYNYRTLEGITTILSQMNRRIKHNTDLTKSVEIMQNNLPLFEKNFDIFFKEIKNETKNYLRDLNKNHNN